MPSSLRLLFTAIATSLLLSACGVTPRQPAPVEDRNPPPATAAAVPAPAPSAASAPDAKPPLPGAENAGKPGYYTVKPGDALIRIALDNGQGWRDVAKWNNLENPNRIEVGQVLRVVPPGVDASAVTAKPIGNTAKAETRPLDAKPPVAAAGTASAPTTSSPSPASTAAASEDDSLAWGWPVVQPISAGFDEQRNKGLDFAGKPEPA